MRHNVSRALPYPKISQWLRRPPLAFVWLAFAFVWMALPCVALYCPALPCIALHCPALLCVALHWPSLAFVGLLVAS
jgi:hypothetical protein